MIDLAQWIIGGTVTLALVWTCRFVVNKDLHVMGNNIWGNRTREEKHSSEENPPPGEIKVGLQLNESVYELYHPQTGTKIEVDIVFFHGLRPDDYEGAYWKAFTAAGDEKVIWPKEWLSRALPTARILSVSYDANAKGFDKKTLGENMVADVITNGDIGIGQNCPVFLVGHSLGGLVIKNLILSALDEQLFRESDRITKFLENFRGVFYYSTPHGGSQIANQIQNPSPILQLLQVVNREAGQINEEFQTERRIKLKIAAAAVFEDSPTNYLGSTTEIAEEASARRDVDKIYKFKDADHFTVCKARRWDDHTVIGYLAQFIDDEMLAAGRSITYVPLVESEESHDNMT